MHIMKIGTVEMVQWTIRALRPMTQDFNKKTFNQWYPHCVNMLLSAPLHQQVSRIVSYCQASQVMNRQDLKYRN